jgi:hypothetical protein
MRLLRSELLRVVAVELEQKVEGLLNSFTDLQNPDFGEVARAMGLWGQRVERAEDLDAAVRDCFAGIVGPKGLPTSPGIPQKCRATLLGSLIGFAQDVGVRSFKKPSRTPAQRSASLVAAACPLSLSISK